MYNIYSDDFFFLMIRPPPKPTLTGTLFPYTTRCRSPENYRELDNSVLAANLKGKRLLAYGDMDENAFPAVTLQLCAALNQANRSYDLLYIPNGTHFYLAEPYFLRR